MSFSDTLRSIVNGDAKSTTEAIDEVVFSLLKAEWNASMTEVAMKHYGGFQGLLSMSMHNIIASRGEDDLVRKAVEGMTVAGPKSRCFFKRKEDARRFGEALYDEYSFDKLSLSGHIYPVRWNGGEPVWEVRLLVEWFRQDGSPIHSSSLGISETVIELGGTQHA